MLVTVIGRGHSGTRAISQTLSESNVYMGEPLNKSWDLIPPHDMYEACRVFAKYVKYLGGMKWDFSKVMEMDPDPVFVKLIESYLSSVLKSDSVNKGWKIPETTLVYPWIQKMFPKAYYIHWVRDPRDCILSSHMTDDLNDFGIEYDKSGDIRKNRAISWYYQRELVRNTPFAEHQVSIRFEDMVYEQDKTIEKLEEFLNIPLVKIPMRTDSVGRYLTDNDVHMYDFFKNDMKECGYGF
ncbi:MAG: sulfotransferase [Clostridia bacterium]|jgi:hypothetical protein|nr:sulfotransferase [Clostridia bacterium]HQM95937.1 sulfotransferase [Clostridia bacterium]